MYILRKKPVYTLRYLPDFLSKDDVFKNTALICDKQHEKLRVDLLDLKIKSLLKQQHGGWLIGREF